MNIFDFWNRIFELALEELRDFINIYCKNSRSKCNISTLIVQYMCAIVQQHTGSSGNQPSELTGKVWCKSSAVPQL